MRRPGAKNAFRRFVNSVLSITSTKRIVDARAWVARERSRSTANLQRGYVAPIVVEQRPSQVLIRKPPITSESEVHSGFVNHYLAETPRCGTFILHGARILGSEGYVMSPEGEVFEEFTYDRRGPDCDYDLYYRLRKLPITRVPGWWATITYPDSTELFHFELESLPRLDQLEFIRPLLDGLIVPERLRHDHLKALAELGWSGDHLLRLKPDSHLAFDNLVVPAYLAGKNTPAWVRDVFSRLPSEDSGQTAKRVYVSRRDARWRHVLNEDEVFKVLEKLGFKMFVLSDLTPGMQRALFGQAEFVVAPHGAALSKIVHSQPGMKMVEIFSPHHVDSTYWTLAESFGLMYAYTVGRTRPASQVKADFEDIDVDIEKLEAIVRLMLGR